MIIDGKWLDNITCPRCHYRHPAEVTCERAAEEARKERERRASVQDTEDEVGVFNCPHCNEPIYVRGQS